MKKLKNFTINYASLNDGEHDFDFFIDDKFFEHFEYSLIKIASVKVNLQMCKFLDSLQLTFDISGTVNVACDVCLDNFDLEIKSDELINYKIVQNIPDDDNSSIIYITEGESSIHLADTLYELISLSLPIRKVHPDDEDGFSTCNKKMLEYLELKDSSDTKKSSNPIWDELKKLK